MDRRRGREDHRPDPAPFPADDGSPSRLWMINIGRQLRAQVKTVGRRVRGSATGEVQRLSGPRTMGLGITAPPPVGHRWTISRRRGTGKNWFRQTGYRFRKISSFHIPSCHEAWIKHEVHLQATVPLCCSQTGVKVVKLVSAAPSAICWENYTCMLWFLPEVLA